MADIHWQIVWYNAQPLCDLLHMISSRAIEWWVHRPTMLLKASSVHSTHDRCDVGGSNTKTLHTRPEFDDHTASPTMRHKRVDMLHRADNEHCIARQRSGQLITNRREHDWRVRCRNVVGLKDCAHRNFGSKLCCLFNQEWSAKAITVAFDYWHKELVIPK